MERELSMGSRLRGNDALVSVCACVRVWVGACRRAQARPRRRLRAVRLRVVRARRGAR